MVGWSGYIGQSLSFFAPFGIYIIYRQNNSQLFKIMGEPSKSHKKTERLLVGIENELTLTIRTNMIRLKESSGEHQFYF